jgi:hypothetical protein
VKNNISAAQKRQLVFGKAIPILLYGQLPCYPTNKSDRFALERLLRYAARVVSNDYTGNYGELLSKVDVQPIYQTVIHRRILLAEQYCTGLRYLPPGVLQPFVHRSWTRRRTNDRALRLSTSSSLRIHNSALEDIVMTWNRLPNELARLRKPALKKALAEQGYQDNASEIYDDMRHVLHLL